VAKPAATKPTVDFAIPAAGNCALTEKEFQQIRELAHARFGLDLRDGKQQLVAARLGKKIRQGGFASFAEYHRHVTADASGQALVELIDALATNHTAFLREQAHFDLLTDIVRGAAGRLPSIWSAACSTGEEPYSIVFTALNALSRTPAPHTPPFVLATDISTKALDHARRGCFAPDRLAGLPDAWKKGYLLRMRGEREGWQQVRPEIASLIEFRRMNLIEPFRHGRSFDVIFCRNVMIYFDRGTQQDLVSRLAGCLHPNGYLFVGHSESLSGIEHPLEYVCPAVYRRRQKR
jgi:chemotaxis protein methyltransferase CheR